MTSWPRLNTFARAQTVLCLLAWAGLLAIEARGSQGLTYYREPFPIFEEQKIVSHGLWDGPQSPSFEDLRKAFSEGAFNDYPGFVSYLLSQAPGLRSRNVLIHHSESQQMSSYLHPRAILYQGGTFYGLSDHPDQKARRVEIMQAKRDSFDLEMKEIVFRGPNQVEFREDPKSCKLCHGSPAQPLWTAYGQWEVSTYGSRVYGAKDYAYSQYQGFLEHSKNLPSYRELDPVNTDVGGGHYAKEDLDRIWGFSNTVINLHLRNWLGRAFAQDRVSYADGLQLVGTIAKCIFPLSGSKSAGVDGAIKSGNAFYYSYLRELGLKRFGVKIKEFGKANESDTLFFQYPGVSQFLNRIFYYGAPVESFGVNLALNTYFLNAPGDIAQHLLTTLYEVRPDLFANIKWNASGLTFAYDQNSLVKIDCSSLVSEIERTRHLATNLGGLPDSVAPSFRAISKSRPALSSCIQCHVLHASDVHKTAPEIPFNDAAALAQALRAPGSRLKDKILRRISLRGKGQMPPGEGMELNEEEMEAMREFLDAISEEESS